MGSAPLTRRTLLLAGVATAACALPWQQQSDRAPVYTPPVQTPIRFGPTKLRLVLAKEGHTPLDAALQEAVTQTARQLSYTLDLLDLSTFAGAGPTPSSSDIARQLLVTVQAGVPPDGLLLLGRQAQTARLQTMGLLQEVSGLMRSTRARLGPAPETNERAHFIGGNWFAAPLYQRLIGHWVRPEPFTRAGLDPEAATATYADLRASLSRLNNTWAIAPDDTPEADAWCWGVIHAWGGALTDKSGERVTLASPETAAALNWLATAFRDTGTAPDAPYLYTEGVPPPGAALVTGPGGPTFRPRVVDGGAVWLLPRGAAPDPPERLWEALFQPAVQRQLWTASNGVALPIFESLWSDSAIAALPNQPDIRLFRALLATGGFISDTGQAGKPTAASQAVESGRLAVRMVRAILAGQPIDSVLAAAQSDAEAIYKEHAFPEG